MIETLNKYLIQHKSINIPGLGTIFIEHRPAIFDVVNKRILPPHYEFRFNKYFDTPDKEFFSYLSNEKGIPDYEAIQLYNQFAQDLRTTIKQEDKAEWKDVGVFTRNDTGDIMFESDSHLSSLYVPVAATRIERDVEVPKVENKPVEVYEQKAEEPVVQRKSWLVYAGVVLLITVLFIIYHFYMNGFNVGAVGNSIPF